MSARLFPAVGVTVVLGAALAGLPGGLAGRLPGPPPPLVAAAPTSTSLAAVSCLSASWCLSVGGSSAGTGTLAKFWDGSYWALRPPPATANLDSLSCVSPRFCAAVGYLSGSPVAEEWTGRRWELVPVASPGGSTSAWLDSVSCVSAVSCLAVGFFTPNHGQSFAAIAERWDGREWSLARVVQPVRETFAELASVSCRRASCLAVGEFHTASDHIVPLAERWNGSYFSLVAVADPPGTVGAGLVGLSCAAAWSCVAVGSYGTAGGSWDALSEEWNGRRFAVVPAETPAGASSASLDSVSCTVRDCMAVGNATADYVSAPLAEMLIGGRWIRRAPAPAGATPTAASFAAVACPAVTACEAVGVASAGVAAAESWNGRLWFVPIPSPIVAAAAAATGDGYYLVAADGTVYCYGAAGFHGDMAGRPLGAPIVGMAVDPSTGGYWLLGADGGIFAFDAPFYGSTGAERLNAPVVGMAAAPAGRGYRLVAADGGIFDFGPAARFLGSMGGTHLNQPIVAMAADPATGGYWLVAADGGIFAFHAPFRGSTGAIRLARPIVGMEALANGAGYRLVASDGGVFAFGADFSGSLGGHAVVSTVVTIVAGPGMSAYWLMQASGGVTGLGGASDLGGP